MIVINGLIKKIGIIMTLILSDIIAIASCFILSFYIRSWLFVDIIPIFDPMFHGINVYLNSWAILFLWVMIFAYEGLYPSIGISFWDETKSILKGNTLAFLIVIVLTFVTKTSAQFSRPVIVLALLLSIFLLPLSRYLSRYFLYKNGLWYKDVLILGEYKSISQVLCNLRKHPDLGLRPIGAVVPSGETGDIDLPVNGNIEHIEDLSTSASEMIVAMPGLNRKEMVEIIERATKIVPVVKIIPDLYGIASAGVKTYDIDGMLLLEIEDRLSQTRNCLIKRLFDVILSLAGLIAISPLLLCISILIKADSSGPVLFLHRRLGKKGIEFNCYKFRTMVNDAHERIDEILTNDTAARQEWEREHKLKNDPRITRVGRFLRRASLDELPQLINVLRGEMSLVGPRPVVAEEIKKYGDKSRYLFKVLPGITGLWQVSGRSDIDYEERILIDEYYAKNWSLWLDIEVVIRTVASVWKKEGAY